MHSITLLTALFEKPKSAVKSAARIGFVLAKFLTLSLYRNFTPVLSLKPRLHERFFACDGDAIFLKLSRRQRAAKIAYVATL